MALQLEDRGALTKRRLLAAELILYTVLSAMLAHSLFFQTDKLQKMDPELPLHLSPLLGYLTLAHLPISVLSIKYKWALVSLMFYTSALLLFSFYVLHSCIGGIVYFMPIVAVVQYKGPEFLRED